ncbi:hypothetical protein LY90DRAFT_507793 [Neocallimastix californiae]|uniref:Periplasmic binding protein-like II n=1 Tax=Neocallimastix californiae TaxID=1754190 RepID=A0A1Y2D520_9FUNG|nr:hypothetical protein LY90DRAFT_507793 [Neocallimastix californiae]|eukprot:ORY54234.1 hypothetical protein LY90DRAFT_507793 [Neocallimastix californiae]
MKEIKYCYGIIINSIGFSETGACIWYTSMINKFNNYSKENNLNITLQFNYYSRINSTNNVGDDASQLDILFIRHSPKYDIILYDNIYSRRYGSHLLNLKEWLPNDHINLYSDNILSKTSLYKDKLVGLPVAIDSTVLYYNHELLNKYNKTIPKTWDKLLNTTFNRKSSGDKEKIIRA